jgi:hypothetical protein
MRGAVVLRRTDEVPLPLRFRLLVKLCSRVERVNFKSSPERGGGAKRRGGPNFLAAPSVPNVGPFRPVGAPPRSGEDFRLS